MSAVSARASPLPASPPGRPAAPVPLAPPEDLSGRDFERLALVIQNYSGIKMASGKQSMLSGRMRRLADRSGFDSLKDYCRYLLDEGGLQHDIVPLIDAVTTNKTDFFREPAHFDFVRDKVLPALASEGRRTLSAWSSACSTGAEAYTLAMVIEEHRRKRPGLDYTILCSDLCTQVLDQALEGVFPEAMIAPVPPELRPRYLRKARRSGSDQVRIAPELRAKIAFARLNLMDDVYPVAKDFDLLFCRNLLIYFERPTQEAVLKRLCRHIRPGGHLFLGHSESIAGMDLPVTQVANTIFERR